MVSWNVLARSAQPPVSADGEPALCRLGVLKNDARERPEEFTARSECWQRCLFGHRKVGQPSDAQSDEHVIVTAEPSAKLIIEFPGAQPGKLSAGNYSTERSPGLRLPRNDCKDGIRDPGERLLRQIFVHRYYDARNIGSKYYDIFIKQEGSNEQGVRNERHCENQTYYVFEDESLLCICSESVGLFTSRLVSRNE
ncbi:hypothetical protein TNCV_3472341 [Trichonephila clavipes]|nr:hypothetical protein TNCV_3472341 [Trichonephila clavipes]